MEIIKNAANSKKGSAVIHVLVCVLIGFVILYRLNQLDNVFIIGDEFGYFANAAHLAGYDWTSVGAVNPYYSFGYSLILLPLFLLKNASLMYKAAVFGNYLLLVISYFIINYLVGKLSEKTDVLLSSSIAAACVLYTANVFNAQTALAETLIFTVFNIVLFLFYKVINNQRKLNIVLLSLASVYLIAVHMRAVVVFIAISICLFILMLKKKLSVGKFFLFFIVAVLPLFLILFVKRFFMGGLYDGSIYLAFNDFSGQVPKLAILFGEGGFLKFLYGLIGKLWYIGCATYFIAWWAFIPMIRSVKKVFGKEATAYDHVCFFAFLCFVGALLLSTFYFLTVDRVDKLLYGRYTEYVITAVVMTGLIEIINNRKRMLIHVAYVLAGYGATMLIQVMLDFYENPEILYSNNLIGVSYLAGDLIKKVEYTGFEHIVFRKVLIISVILIILISVLKDVLKKGAEISIPIIVALIAFSWAFMADAWASGTMYVYHDSDYIERFEQVLASEPGDTIVFPYFVDDTKSTLLKADYLQYYYMDKKVVLTNVDDVDTSYDGPVIVPKTSGAIWAIMANYEWLLNSRYFAMGIRIGSEKYNTIRNSVVGLEQKISFEKSAYEDGLLSSMQFLGKGKYSFRCDLSEKMTDEAFDRFEIIVNGVPLKTVTEFTDPANRVIETDMEFAGNSMVDIRVYYDETIVKDDPVEATSMVLVN